MLTQFSRTELLLGKDGVEKLKKSSVAVFGVGGVGSYIAEGLVRSGIGKITLVDNDTVNITNINRQLIALHSTMDRLKVDAARERLLDINPKLKIQTYDCFYTGSEVELYGFEPAVTPSTNVGELEPKPWTAFSVASLKSSSNL